MKPFPGHRRCFCGGAVTARRELAVFLDLTAGFVAASKAGSVHVCMQLFLVQGGFLGITQPTQHVDQV